MKGARRVRCRGSCSSAGRRTKRDTRQMTEERHDDPWLSPAPVCHTETNHYGGITRGPFGGGVFWGAAWDGRLLGQKRRVVEYCANVTGAGTLDSVWHRIWASAMANPVLCFSLPARQIPLASCVCPVRHNALLRAASGAVSPLSECAPEHQHKPKMPAWLLQAIQPRMTLTIGRSPT